MNTPMTWLILLVPAFLCGWAIANKEKRIGQIGQVGKKLMEISSLTAKTYLEKQIINFFMNYFKK